MDILVNLLPDRPRGAVKLFVDASEVVVTLVIAVLAVPVIAQLAIFDERSQAAEMPLAIPQALIPLGLLLVALVTAARISTRRALQNEIAKASSSLEPLDSFEPEPGSGAGEIRDAVPEGN